MKPRIHINRGRVIDPANQVDRQTPVYIADGRVVALDRAPDGFTPDQTIDATGCWVIPGLVDLRAALREPGAEHKATIASELAAAAAGGITSLCSTPDTQPVADSEAVIELIHHRAGAVGGTRVYPLGAATLGLAGAQLAEMATLAASGCAGFCDSVGPVTNNLIRWRMMQYAASHDLLLYLRPWDSTLAAAGCMHDGTVCARLGLPGIPVEAEIIGLQRDIALARRSGARVHFCGISSAQGAAILAHELPRNKRLSADVSAHQLYLTDDDCGSFNSLYRVDPPLRSNDDRTALRQALAAGTLSAVCSDHQPHEADAKLQPFSEAEPGISALETLLPLVLQLIGGELTASTAIAAITSGPARILGIDAGHLGLQAVADVCVVDPERTWQPATDGWLSSGRNTPFMETPLRGRATWTIAGGEIIARLDRDE
ncbi:MAG: dihydroorotase [Gammaproteobacteria bacterium]|nr:dihydroorotase [Gammaproteobacteria bacterium]